MSTLTLRVSIRHEGKAIPRFPLTRRIEDTTNIAVPLDARWPDTDPQEIATTTGTPFTALRFDDPALCQMGTYTGVLTFAMAAESMVLMMGSGGISFTPAANSRVRGVV